MPSFDLRDEPWIPVAFLDGTAGTVGLRDALRRAHEIREIALDNPMELAGLYRLLLALAVRIFPRTEEIDDWFTTWEAGRFDPAPIADYFDRWADRFDLFGTERPFYQVRTNMGNGLLPVTLLRMDEGGNTSALFSHADLKEGMTMAPAEAARGLIASQHAAIGGLLSNPYKTGNRNSPAVGGAIFWLHGRSLFQALLLNAPPSSSARMNGTAPPDAPAWEADEPKAAGSRPHVGFLDYLTFQHRRITLLTTDGEAATVVSGIHRTGGEAEEVMPLDDPHMAIINDEKLGPRRYNVVAGKAVWRDASVFLVLLPKQRGTPPATFQWAQSNRDYLGMRRIDAEAFAVRTRGANDGTVRMWRRERLPVFLNILAEPRRGEKVAIALERADRQAYLLGFATKIAAGRILAPAKEFGALGTIERAEATALARTFDCEARYWAALEPRFTELLEGLAGPGDPERDPDWGAEELRGWTELIHRTALEAYDRGTGALDANARQLRALVLGRIAIRPAGRYRLDGNAQHPTTQPMEAGA